MTSSQSLSRRIHMKIRTSLNRSHTCDGVTIHYRAVADSMELMEVAPDLVGAILPEEDDKAEPTHVASVKKMPSQESIDRGIAMLRFVRSRITSIEGAVLESDEGEPQEWGELDDYSQRYVFAQLGDISQSYMTAFYRDIMPTRAEVSE